MCLITTQKKPLIAKKDITVYKVLIEKVDDNGSTVYISPFIEKRYECGTNTPYRGKNWTEEKSVCQDYDINKNIIEKGWLHAFIGVYEAYLAKTYMLKYKLFAGKMLPSDKLVTVEMTIPKGAKYFIGFEKDICTDKLCWNKKDKPLREQ